MRTQLTIKTHIAKLKWWDETLGPEHPNENDLEDTQQTELQQFPVYGTNVIWWWNRIRHKFPKFKAKGSLPCGSYID